MTERHRLAFVSPRFLFPADSGGKIRTTQILRGMKGGAFDITLVMPGSEAQRHEYRDALQSVCDSLHLWEEGRFTGLFGGLRRMAMLASRFPLSVISDYSASGAATVKRIIDSHPDVIVFDFPHSAILISDELNLVSIMFTHNVESEILERHWRVARSPFMRKLWSSQHRKMCSFEKAVLSTFDTVVAVSLFAANGASNIAVQFRLVWTPISFVIRSRAVRRRLCSVDRWIGWQISTRSSISTTRRGH